VVPALQHNEDACADQDERDVQPFERALAKGHQDQQQRHERVGKHIGETRKQVVPATPDLNPAGARLGIVGVRQEIAEVQALPDKDREVDRRKACQHAEGAPPLSRPFTPGKRGIEGKCECE